MRRMLSPETTDGVPEFTILDDIYPYLLSGFRIAEYNWLLRRIPDSAAFSITGDFPARKKEFSLAHPDLADRVRHMIELRGADRFYTVFIHNAHQFLPVFEKYEAPFAFTLYPGGGLHVGDPECEEHLRRVGGSELLYAVIVTMTETLEYVRRERFFPPEKVHFVYGGVLDSDYFKRNLVPKRLFPRDKDTFDICFVAMRYDPRGITKGYDVFVEVAKKLAPVHPALRFHVVGSLYFDEEDEVDTSVLGDRITFYGTRTTRFFPEFYAGMDMILSPNRAYCHPHVRGLFDGFPTGSGAEAGLCGTAVLCTDPLGMNVCFEDGRDIRLIPGDIDGICAIVEEYIADPEELYALSERTRRSFAREFDIEIQMSRRLEILYPERE